MLKRKMSALIATTCVLSMVMGSTVFAAGLTDQTATVTVTEKDPVWNIIVPTTMAVTIDPYSLIDGNSQIYSTDYSIVNKSQAAVEVNAVIKITPGDGVTLKSSADDVTDSKTGDKSALIQAKIAKTVTENAKAATDFDSYASIAYKDASGNYFTADTDPSSLTALTADEKKVVQTLNTKALKDVTYDDAAPVVTLGADETTFTFALDKAQYTTYYTGSEVDPDKIGWEYKELAASTAGSASFRFVGKLNSLQTWTSTDITPVVKYTFTGLTPANYTADAAKFDAKGHQFITYVAPVTDKAPSIATTSYTATAGTAIDVAVDLGAGTKAATGITSITFDDGAKTLATTNYSFDSTTSTLTFTSAFIDTCKSYSVGTRNYVITFNDTDSTTATITIVH